MSHPTELLRWVDDPAASEALKLALREQGEEGPTPAQRALLFEQLAGRLEGAPHEASVPPLGRPLRKLVLGSVGIVLLGSVAWWTVRTPSVSAPLPAPLSVRAGAPAAPAHVDQLVPPKPTPQERPPAPPAPGLDQVRPAVRPRPKRTIEAAPVAPRVDPALELSLLTSARRALLDQPQRALALTAEHERDYAQGLLAEEREVIAIEALLKLSRRSDAVRRAQRFVVRFPGSAQRVRLEQLLGPAAQSAHDGPEDRRSSPH